jgi:hypothetical protein
MYLFFSFNFSLHEGLVLDLQPGRRERRHPGADHGTDTVEKYVCRWKRGKKHEQYFGNIFEDTNNFPFLVVMRKTNIFTSELVRVQKVKRKYGTYFPCKSFSPNIKIQ